MAPCTSRSGYRGVRERPPGMFHVEIRSGEERFSLGSYETAHEVAHAYDAAAWRLGRPPSSMNFQDARNRQHAQDLAPPLQVVTPAAHARERERERRLFAAERREQERRAWALRFPEVVAAERDFYARKKADLRAAKKADREARRAKKLAKAEEEARRKAEKLVRRNSGVPPEFHITKLPESDSDWSPDEGWDANWLSTPVSDTTSDSSDYDWNEEYV